MNVVGLKQNNGLEYQDLILFMENMKLNNNFTQIQTQNIGEIYFE
jgi:hypothetical protein